MIKKPEFKDFDQLKNPDLEYRYSREERLKEHGRPLYQGRKSKGLARFFGGNKMVATMVVFYIILGVFIFGYFTLYERAESREFVQSFTAGQGQRLQVRLITNRSKYGLNVTLQNKSKTNWTVRGYVLELPQWTNQVVQKLILTPGEFDAFFYSIPTNITNLTGLDVRFEGESNGT